MRLRHFDPSARALQPVSARRRTATSHVALPRWWRHAEWLGASAVLTNSVRGTQEEGTGVCSFAERDRTARR